MNNLVHKNKNKDLPPKNSLKRNVSQRVLLDKEIMSYVNEWVTQLKRDSCKVSVSKVVNTSLKIFFQKYESLEYENVARGFFDKKSYLIKLIQSSNNENMDESIKLYLDKVNISKKKLGRKPKRKASEKTPDILGVQMRPQIKTKLGIETVMGGTETAKKDTKIGIKTEIEDESVETNTKVDISKETET